MTVAAAGKLALPGPPGPRPRRLFDPARIAIYTILIIAASFYLFPLYVMITTSLKDLDTILYGNIFLPPTHPTLDAWVKAWDSACTGLYCEGLKVGFWNSVKITIPSVAGAIAVGSVTGYIMAMWRYRGANFFFTILVFALFIPPNVLFYPLVEMARGLGIFGTLPAVILLNIVLGLPLLALMFRNYFASLPPDLFRAARVDGAGFWRIYFQVLMPLSLPILAGAVILEVTLVWNDYLFSYIFGGMFNIPMTVQFHNIVGNFYGTKEYNVEMAATILTGAVPLIIYFASGRLFVRGIAAGAIQG